MNNIQRVERDIYLASLFVEQQQKKYCNIYLLTVIIIQRLSY